MAASKTSSSTTARPEHPNADEAGENNLKNKFMKMIETLKEKNSLKDMEERTNKQKITERNQCHFFKKPRKQSNK